LGERSPVHRGGAAWVSALRRRLANLERQLNTPLITRHVDGIRLTAEGQQIFDAACQMETAAFGMMRAKDATAPDVSGEVKIAVTEGTGTFWLAPRLVELQRAYPKLLVNLKCLMTPADVSSLEADLAVQLIRPNSPELKVVRLGFLHTMPFAAQSYINTYGLPTSLEELKTHRLVLHVAEQTEHEALFRKFWPDVPFIGTVALKTNVASAHLWAIAKGAGIGWLPTYTHFIGGRIVPIEIKPRFVLASRCRTHSARAARHRLGKGFVRRPEISLVWRAVHSSVRPAKGLSRRAFNQYVRRLRPGGRWNWSGVRPAEPAAPPLIC